MTELAVRLPWPFRNARRRPARRHETAEAIDNPGWSGLHRSARVYVAAVIAAGAGAVLASLPLTWPHPILFAVLLIASCLTSAWKVTLPIPVASGSTLSVSYAANLMALLLLGPRRALIIAVVGAWTQCTIGMARPYQRYRTAFSAAAEAVTMAATAAAYVSLGGTHGQFEVSSLARPLVGAIATYFVLNTGLVAGAIAELIARK